MRSDEANLTPKTVDFMAQNANFEPERVDEQRLKAEKRGGCTKPKGQMDRQMNEHKSFCVLLLYIKLYNVK